MGNISLTPEQHVLYLCAIITKVPAQVDSGAALKGYRAVI